MRSDVHAVLLPTASAVLCLVFAVALGRQWVARRRPHQVVWAIGMTWYGAAAGADAVGQIWGWSEAGYRVWYLSGAIMAAAWLGLGEVFLIKASGHGEVAAAGIFLGSVPAVIRAGRFLQAGQPDEMTGALLLAAVGIGVAIALALASWHSPEVSGKASMAALLVGGSIATYVVLTARIDPALMLDPSTGVPQGAGFDGGVRILSPIFNVGGALMLVFGAVHSARTFFTRDRNIERTASNVLIALGAVTPSVTGLLNRWGFTTTFYAGEFLGVLFIFAGFLASREVISRHGRTLPGLAWQFVATFTRPASATKKPQP